MQTVLITGASGGIGRKTAEYFAKNGWHVIATVISFNELNDLDKVPNVFCYEMNVTSTENIERAKQEILQKHSKIDVVINNAGIGYRSFVELSEDSKIDAIVNINWLGVVKVCRAFIPKFREQNFGQFINITSVAGLVNLPLGNFYHSTKQGVESFSECMAYELKPFNISVSTVQFGNAPTDFQKNVTKCCATPIESYNKLMLKISEVLAKKSGKNQELPQQIVEKLFLIASNPKKSFTRYTIGFDANAMKWLRRILGYKLFDALISKVTLK